LASETKKANGIQAYAIAADLAEIAPRKNYSHARKN